MSENEGQKSTEEEAIEPQPQESPPAGLSESSTARATSAAAHLSTAEAAENPTMHTDQTHSQETSPHKRPTKEEEYSTTPAKRPKTDSPSKKNSLSNRFKLPTRKAANPSPRQPPTFPTAPQRPFGPSPVLATENPTARAVARPPHTHPTLTARPASRPAPQRTPREKAFLVERATELVCRALLSGPWPQLTDFDIVVAALQQFSADIIVPVLHAVDPIPTALHETPIILGTLLMLREILILNADSIFGIPSGDDSEDSRCTETDDDRQSQHFAACSLATSVILSALDSPNGACPETYAPRFLRMIDAYESGQGDFAQLMTEGNGDDADSTILLPNGTTMARQERTDWRASYRWHAQTHPSTVARRFGPTIRPIQPNAVHISVIGASEDTSD